jgi:hypothetical protein
VHKSTPCRPGRPAHSRSRAYFKAAAALALVAGSLSGSLSTQAMAADYTNPAGNTFVLNGQNWGSYQNINNLGVMTNTSGYAGFYIDHNFNSFNNTGRISSGTLLVYFVNDTFSSLTNTGIITGNSDGVALGNSNVTTLTNTGLIQMQGRGITLSSQSHIGVLNNSGTIRSTTREAISIYYSGATIDVINNSGTISGSGSSILNYGGTITTINLLSGSTMSGNIQNSGTIGTINIFKTLASGDFNTSSIVAPTVSGNQAGATRRFLTIDSGSSVGTVTNSINLYSFTNSGAIQTVTNAGAITSLTLNATSAIGNFTNSGTITSALVNQGNITSLSLLYGSTLSGGLNNQGNIGSFTNSSSLTALTNSGTITVLNLLEGSDITGGIANSGTIATLNVYKTLSGGDYDTAGIFIPAISGNQAGATNRFLTIDSGSNVGTVTNSVNLSSLSNTGTIAALTNNTGCTIATLTNSGAINALANIGTLGAFSNEIGSTVGIFNNSGNVGTINNSGTLTTLTNSAQIGSITNSGLIGTLNLLAGSAVTGNIDNPGTINTLNLNFTGISCCNYDVQTPTITGNQPITVNFLGLPTNGHCLRVSGGGHMVSVDTSTFGANANAVRQVSNSVAHLTNTNSLVQSIGAKASKHAADPYTMTSDLCADGTPTPAAQIGNSDFWVRGFTGRNNVDASASTVNYINTYSGGAVGVDRDWSEDIRGGVFIGAGTMKNSLGGGLGGTDTNLLFAGTYATKTWGTTFAKVGLTGGRGSNTGTRNIAGSTPETATADYKSWYVSPEVSVGRVYALGQHLGGEVSVTPVLSARYVYASQDGYTETGATSTLTMGSSSSTTVEERAELKFSYATRAFNDSGVKINASIGGIGQQNSGGAQNGTLLGTPLSFATPGQTNTTGFVGGLGFEVNRGRYTFSASGDYVRLSGGNADLSANVVFSVKF